jgi:hypothetical protein
MHVGMGVDASWVGVKGVSVASGMDVDIEGARRSPWHMRRC